MREINEKRLAELQLIRERSGGFLPPRSVVDYARDPATALHSAFNWDDTEAAELYRLQQARNLIRVMVVVENVGGGERVIRPFVSIMEDRAARSGYRAYADVMEDEELRERMLRTALVELRGVQKRYREVKELASVFEAIDKVAGELPLRTATNGADGEARQAAIG